MNLGRTVFSQIMEHLPEYEFQKCVARYLRIPRDADQRSELMPITIPK